MSLTSIDHLLEVIAKQPKWNEYRRYIEICDIWSTIVSQETASQSQPLYVQRDMLWIAVSSSGWAQQLSFQSYSLLKQLNHHLSGSPLHKLRFSPAQWHSHPGHQPLSSADKGRSFFAYTDTVKPSPKTPQTPEEAFQRWTDAIAHHLNDLPLCPHCHCPTPSVELERWSQCYLCITQHWQTKSLSNLE
ncbi:DUF721 domain-containing protein [Cyanothece sp. BG0011]|uniref:DUF721 domain-containing protein n=1 Tax=Cyanothece sp. BG0011 TaxID=2082950 RepID=UPI000D1D7446|nr:DciA family protein [Cyanothece sp. BG0011]